MVVCRFGVVKVIVDKDRKKAIVVYSPAFYETYLKIVKELEDEGYEIVRRLNTGVDVEAEEAERLLELCFKR
jgi:hypothetical protein